MQTGLIFAQSAGMFDPSERSRGREALLPNVRLANGGVARDVRRRLMLAFNSPFFPEVLIASAVMAEGVDLHLECRYVIHHDLDWNPSVLEQRTGRLDRLGSKAEASGQPIVVYEPYLEATQDEKQYRVVKDRERWFNIVMGGTLQLDESSTDRLARRVPLPEEVARKLTLQLAIRGY
jgi:superfamily II DNA/RNA helicase